MTETHVRKPTTDAWGTAIRAAKVYRQERRSAIRTLLAARKQWGIGEWEMRVLASELDGLPEGERLSAATMYRRLNEWEAEIETHNAEIFQAERHRHLFGSADDVRLWCRCGEPGRRLDAGELAEWAELEGRPLPD